MMPEFIASMFWAGGLYVAYPSLRNEGCGPVRAVFHAIFWPAILGVVVAKWVDRNNPTDEEDVDA